MRFSLSAFAAIATLTAIATTASRARADEPPPDREEAVVYVAPMGEPLRPPPRSSGFMFGASVGYRASINGPDVATAIGSGPSFTVSAGYRWRSFYGGLAYNHAFLGSAAWTEKTGWETTTSGSTDYAGVDFVKLFSENGAVGFFLRTGMGYRVVTVQTTSNVAPWGPVTNEGFDGSVGVGLELNLRGKLRVVPEAMMEIGPSAAATLALTTFYDFGPGPAGG